MSLLHVKGFTCGAFDLLHVGHLYMLQQCKQHCQELIVGLQTNPTLDRTTKNSPVQSLYERYVQLESTKYVDKIIPYDDEKDLENLLATLDISIRFLGEEYRNQPITGLDICRQRAITLIYTARKHSYSSSELRQRVFKAQELRNYTKGI